MAGPRDGVFTARRAVLSPCLSLPVYDTDAFHAVELASHSLDRPLIDAAEELCGDRASVIGGQPGGAGSDVRAQLTFEAHGIERDPRSRGRSEVERRAAAGD